MKTERIQLVGGGTVEAVRPRSSRDLRELRRRAAEIDDRLSLADGREASESEADENPPG